MAKKAIGSAKRYGTRYGARNRDKVSNVEQQYRGRNKCPYCNKYTVKRVAAGIFKCTKDGNIFTARAYSTQKSEANF